MKWHHRAALLPFSLAVDLTICFVFLAASLCALYQFLRSR